MNKTSHVLCLVHFNFKCILCCYGLIGKATFVVKASELKNPDQMKNDRIWVKYSLFYPLIGPKSGHFLSFIYPERGGFDEILSEVMISSEDAVFVTLKVRYSKYLIP